MSLGAQDGGSYIEAQLPIGDTLEDEDGEAVEIEKDKDGLPLDRLVVTVSKSAAVSIYPTYYHSVRLPACTAASAAAAALTTFRHRPPSTAQCRPSRPTCASASWSGP